MSVGKNWIGKPFAQTRKPHPNCRRLIRLPDPAGSNSKEGTRVRSRASISAE